MKRSYFPYLVLVLALWGPLQGFSQIKVTGRVTSSDDGLPLIGAAILVKTADTGTVTDENGLFELETLDPNSTLVFSFIGYTTQEVALAGRLSLDVSMAPDSKVLSEVVVLGYSDKKRNEVASAVTVVSSEQLRDVTTNNVGSLLQGKVAGVQVVNSSGQPGAQAEIRIRGVASVSAPQGPLYVVDGIVGGNFDPNDVETITVLRDAGATGMYGSQANGGVIVVTTKRSKGKPQFEFRTSTGTRSANHGNLHMMNGRQLYETQRNLYRSLQYNKVDFFNFYNERPRNLASRNFDWVDATFQDAPVQNYYFSASGTSGKMDYYLGASYFDEEGTFINTDFQRLNLRANTTYRFSDRVKLTNNINLSGAQGKGFSYIEMYYSYLSMPWDNPYDENGDLRYVDGNTEGWWSRDKNNPLHTLANSDHPYRGFDLNYDLSLRVDITKWLAFTTANRFAAGTNRSRSFYSPVVAGAYHGTGFISQQTDLNYGGVTTNLLRFNFDRGGDHNFSGLAGFELQGSEYEFTYAEGKGLPEGFDVLTVTSTAKNISGSGNSRRMNSFISQANYNFRGKYFLTGSYRIDGVSSFPPSKRYARFPSVSAAWLASQEDFLQGNAVDELKLRASYGITGMQDIGPYRYLGLFALNTQYNNAIGATPLQLPNDNLTWEKNNQLNFGVDLGLFKRVQLSFDIYRNTTKDLLVQVGQPLSVGFETRWENIGQVENRGFDLSLNATVLTTKDFTWDVNAAIGKVSNEISGLKAPIVVTGSWGISQIYRNGGELYTFYLKKWAGVDAQSGLPTWQDVADADGNPISPTATTEYSQADNQEVGSALPDFQGGFGTSLRWKGLTLSGSAAFMVGNKVYNNTRRFMDNHGHEPFYNLMRLREDESRWQEPGDVATHPNMANSPLSTETSDRLLEDGSFLKIRNITLSYQLPSAVVQKLRLKGLSVAVSADNPFTFTNYWGQDPEATVTPGPFTLPGVSDFKYPNNRQFMGQVRIMF